MIRLAHNEQGIWLEFVHPIFVDNRPLTESEFARLVWNARAMFASNSQFQATPFPVAVHFTHAEPSYRAEYDRIFRAPLVFNSKWNAIRIDPSFLSLRQPPVSRYVFGLLSDRAEALLKNLEISQTVRGRIEGALIPILHTGELTMDMVARKLGLGRQTLYRALKAEDVTFKKLVDDLRHRMALHYLQGQNVSVSETAYLVGFSDATAFSRAFKRWTGKSPWARRRLG